MSGMISINGVRLKKKSSGHVTALLSHYNSMKFQSELLIRQLKDKIYTLVQLSSNLFRDDDLTFEVKFMRQTKLNQEYCLHTGTIIRIEECAILRERDITTLQLDPDKWFKEKEDDDEFVDPVLDCTHIG